MIRIIAGAHRGRRLKSPQDKNVRPTTGRLRESIFSALDHRLGGFPQKRVADIFSGTGAMGLEALSRGAKAVTFVEKHPGALDLLRENIALLEVGGQTEVLMVDVRNLPNPKAQFDVIFIDPPYRKGLATTALEAVHEKAWLDQDGIVVLEADQKEEIKIPGEMAIVKTLKQGFRRGYFIGFK